MSLNAGLHTGGRLQPRARATRAGAQVVAVVRTVLGLEQAGDRQHDAPSEHNQHVDDPSQQDTSLHRISGAPGTARRTVDTSGQRYSRSGQRYALSDQRYLQYALRDRRSPEAHGHASVAVQVCGRTRALVVTSLPSIPMRALNKTRFRVSVMRFWVSVIGLGSEYYQAQ